MTLNLKYSCWPVAATARIGPLKIYRPCDNIPVGKACRPCSGVESILWTAVLTSTAPAHGSSIPWRSSLKSSIQIYFADDFPIERFSVWGQQAG